MRERDLIEQAREAAFGHVVSFIDLAAFLPGQVFIGGGLDFGFFESDRIFAPSFADIINDFMSAEEATSCCLVNLSRTRTMTYNEAAVIFIEKQTTSIEYDAQLRSGGPAAGWLFSMDRYGCASDGGSWSIYCEKGNDVAVIALRDQSVAKRHSSLLRKLHAEAIDILIRQESAAPFPFSSLTPKWRNELDKQYGTRRGQA